ncbi:Rv3654c family TadE-like protein [Nesterenkonia halophila]|uniref:Rv3654c family TadE-like protein n=1 Tax=Nesterenkonia halophila TaxID=302044 RepID=UPI00129159DF|nr:Rv3654c family TadE-like protein [Nesterenkonia halophila]
MTRTAGRRTGAARTTVAGGDRGSGTVLVLAGALVLLMLLATVVLLGAAATGGARAARAADLAALAGADVARGLAPGDPCTVAEQVARRNGAELTACRVIGADGTEVLVVVRRAVGGAAGETLEATGTSRAGPPR